MLHMQHQYDSSADKTSDNVNTFNDNTVYNDVPPPLFSILDVDINDGEDEFFFFFTTKHFNLLMMALT